MRQGHCHSPFASIGTLRRRREFARCSTILSLCRLTAMAALRFIFGSVMILIAVWLAFVPRGEIDERWSPRSMAAERQADETAGGPASETAGEMPAQLVVGFVSLPPDQPQPLSTRGAIEAPTHVVGVQGLNLRAGPSSATPVLGTFPAGTAVVVLSERENWSEVLAGDLRGWMFTRYLDRVQAVR